MPCLLRQKRALMHRKQAARQCAIQSYPRGHALSAKGISIMQADSSLSIDPTYAPLSILAYIVRLFRRIQSPWQPAERFAEISLYGTTALTELVGQTQRSGLPGELIAPAIGIWNQWLRGKRLTQRTRAPFWAGQRGGQRSDLFLNIDHTYFSYDRRILADGTEAMPENASGGTWRVTTQGGSIYLELCSTTGKISLRRLACWSSKRQKRGCPS